MDADHFDAWTKLLVAPRARRAVVRLVAGGAVGGVLARLGLAEHVFAGNRGLGEKCKKNTDCFSGTCDDGECGCPAKWPKRCLATGFCCERNEVCCPDRKGRLCCGESHPVCCRGNTKAACCEKNHKCCDARDKQACCPPKRPKCCPRGAAAGCCPRGQDCCQTGFGDLGCCPPATPVCCPAGHNPPCCPAGTFCGPSGCDPEPPVCPQGEGVCCPGDDSCAESEDIPCGQASGCKCVLDLDGEPFCAAFHSCHECANDGECQALGGPFATGVCIGCAQCDGVTPDGTACAAPCPSGS